jgi:hypothetical protein
MIEWLKRLLVGRCAGCQAKEALIVELKALAEGLADRFMSRDFSHHAFVKLHGQQVRDGKAQTAGGEDAGDELDPLVVHREPMA